MRIGPAGGAILRGSADDDGGRSDIGRERSGPLGFGQFGDHELWRLRLPCHPGTGRHPGVQQEAFVRVVDGLDFLDQAGRAYESPLLGGLNVPRPQFVDLDADGDLDLFLQERTGELMHFENVGSPGEPRFVWRTDRYQNLEVGEWSRFLDFDRMATSICLQRVRSATCSIFGTKARPRWLRSSP